uniref:Capsular polysaccharide transporter n=1 Tax=uncultured bacterium 5H7 TaxID=1701327 RepID=A0A0N9HTK8_9BACT|nr:capsular polysaccharide transporter [uncultured bacterium 5H7]
MSQTTYAADHNAGGFADRVRSAVIWRWGSQVASQLVTWTVTIVIVRLLDPRDYGLFAMTAAVVTAFNFLSGWGFANSLIPAERIDRRQVGQVFGMLLLSNTLLAAAQFLAAPLAADYYNQSMVADMLRLQAVIFLTTPFIALPTALLSRRLDFKSQARANLLSAFVGAAVGLTLALLGYGVWALVWAPISIFAARALGLTLAAKMLVKPIFDFRGAGDIVRFGSALMLSQVFWIVQSQADIVIAGRMFSTHELGLYSEALFVALIFTGRFLPPLNEVAFPAYAELAKAGQPIAPAFLKGVRMIMLIAAPFYIGLSLVAGPLVETMFGPKWLGMIPILSGLALAMPAMALQICCSPATNAQGQARSYLVTNAAGAAIMTVCFLVGVQFGPEGLVRSWQVAAPLLLLVTLAVTLPRIGARWLDLLVSLVPVVLCCTVMATAVVLLHGRIVDLAAPLKLALLGLAGTATYFATLLLGWPEVLRDGWAMIARKRTKA